RPHHSRRPRHHTRRLRLGHRRQRTTATHPNSGPIPSPPTPPPPGRPTRNPPRPRRSRSRNHPHGHTDNRSSRHEAPPHRRRRLSPLQRERPAARHHRNSLQRARHNPPLGRADRIHHRLTG